MLLYEEFITTHTWNCITTGLFLSAYLRLSAAFYINLSSALYFQIYIPRYWHFTALRHCCLLILLSLDSLILTLAIFVGIYEWWGRRVVCDVLKTSTCFQKLHSCNKPLSKGIAVNFGYHLSLKEMSDRKNIWIQRAWTSQLMSIWIGLLIVEKFTLLKVVSQQQRNIEQETPPTLSCLVHQELRLLI